jgi:anion-transporting  ArsA/GET3 family ATPase
MTLGHFDAPLVVVVGAGGVGKTTLAAALGLESARAGARTLVMTFDPSHRLKDALGVGDQAREQAVRVKGAGGRLEVALLDARSTFDRLIHRYAPDEAAAERIFSNRFYRDLAGSLAGILEYMAVERLFEASAARAYDRIILDTPPTRQALDFLEAPDRIVSFLQSGAVKLALKPWWEARGLSRLPLRVAAKGLEDVADRIMGKRLLGDMVEFFRAFQPLYDGFQERAEEVRTLLRARGTLFALVAGPGPDRIPDAMFFARKLTEAGHRLGPVVVNGVTPLDGAAAGRGAGRGPAAEALALFRYLGERDRRGLAEMAQRLAGAHPLVVVPLHPAPPTDLAGLGEIGARLAGAG